MPNRVALFGITIDNVTTAEAVEAVRRLLDDGTGRQYVATPNVDHIVRLSKDPAFRRAYAGASLVLADGMPLIWASRPLGRPLKSRVTGADLFPRVCEMAASIGKSVFLLGGLDGVAARAAKNLQARHPGLQIAGVYSPSLGFERDPAEHRRIVERINRVRPDVLAIGLGAPKQELWIAAHRRELEFGVALCIGAGIDFVAGDLQRAPSGGGCACVEQLEQCAVVRSDRRSSTGGPSKRDIFRRLETLEALLAKHLTPFVSGFLK